MVDLASGNLEELPWLAAVAGFITYFTGGFDDMARAYETVRWIRTRRYEKFTVARLTHLAAGTKFHIRDQSSRSAGRIGEA
jgi:hypothetical protein